MRAFGVASFRVRAARRLNMFIVQATSFGLTAVVLAHRTHAGIYTTLFCCFKPDVTCEDVGVVGYRPHVVVTS